MRRVQARPTGPEPPILTALRPSARRFARPRPGPGREGLYTTDLEPVEPRGGGARERGRLPCDLEDAGGKRSDEHDESRAEERAGANVELLETEDELVFFVPPRRGPFVWMSPLQAYRERTSGISISP